MVNMKKDIHPQYYEESKVSTVSHSEDAFRPVLLPSVLLDLFCQCS